MKARYRLLLAACLSFAAALPVVAAERTVTLDVTNLSCASCSYIVEQTLTDVPGVATATVSMKDKTATVTFDDAQTDVTALTRATANAGYPAQLRE